MHVRLCRSLFVIVLAVASLGGAVGDQDFSALSGAGELIGSLFDRDAYVGGQHFVLFRPKADRLTLQLQGFLLDAVTGQGWSVGFPGPFERRRPAPGVLQELWFVRDAHRITVWAKKRGPVPAARPVTASARTQFVGESDERDLPTLVARSKRVELSEQGVEIVSFNTAPVRVDAADCARYEGRVIDAGAPLNLARHPFTVNIEGVVCRHPEAPWLAADVSHTYRVFGTEPPPAIDASAAAFVRSLRFQPLTGPAVAEVRPLGNVTEPHGLTSERITITGATIRSGAAWLSYTAMRDGKRTNDVLRLDLSTGRIDRHDDRGTLVAQTDSAVWVSRGSLLTRIDTRSNKVTREVQAPCVSADLPHSRLLSNATHRDESLWLRCKPEAAARGKDRLRQRVLRIDSSVGQVTGEMTFDGFVRTIHPAESRLWLAETSRNRDECALHEIEPGEVRILNTTRPDKAVFCDVVRVDGNVAWISWGNLDRHYVGTLEAGSRTTVPRAVLPRGLDASGVVRLGDHDWIVTEDSRSVPPLNLMEVRLRTGFARGALLRVDPQPTRSSGSPVPLPAGRLLGADEMNVWLFTGGELVRVRR